MAWLQLDPKSIAERVKASGVRARIPSMAGSLLRGIVGFTVVSVAGFVPWAVGGKWFHNSVGEVGMYAACAVVFIVLSGLALHRLIIGPGSLWRFYVLFGAAFTFYAIAWIAGWMILHGTVGGLAGLLAGTALMGLVLSFAFHVKQPAVVFQVIAALFVLNALGYFSGGPIEAALVKSYSILAKLLWGVCYGIGFGAGLGLAFYLCQTRARELILSQSAI